MKLRRVLTSARCYLALLLVAIFSSAVYWQYRVNGILYYCSNPFYIEFFAGPQFAHLNQTPLDHYLAPANRVAHLWYSLWFGCFIIPAVLLWIIRIRDKYVARRMSGKGGTALAAKPESSAKFNDATFISRLYLYFTHLLWTTVFVGLVALVILFKVSFVLTHFKPRHAKEYSDATISDKPLLTLKGIDGGGDKAVLYRVAFSPDGKRIASGDWSAVRVWDSNTGEALLTLTGIHSALDVAFSPDGKYLAESGHEHSASIFDARTGQTLRKIEGLEIHGNAVAFSADSKSLAIALGDAVVVREVETGRQLHNLMIGDAMHCVAFSPDSNRIASASRDNSVKVWDAVTGQEIVTFTGHCEQVWDAAFSPDGKRVGSIGRDGAARVWDAANATELFAFFETRYNRNHAPQAFGVSFSPDGKRLATSFGANAIKVWKLAD